MRSKMELMRFWASPKTDWMPERMVEKMPWKISKMEEMRLVRPSTMLDMIAVLFGNARRAWSCCCMDRVLGAERLELDVW